MAPSTGKIHILSSARQVLLFGPMQSPRTSRPLAQTNWQLTWCIFRYRLGLMGSWSRFNSTASVEWRVLLRKTDEKLRPACAISDAEVAGRQQRDNGAIDIAATNITRPPMTELLQCEHVCNESL